MRGPRFLKTAFVALVGLLAVVGLSACRIDTEVTTIVNPDGTGTVTLTVTADAEAVAAEPNLAKELKVDDLVQAGWSVNGPNATETGGLMVVLRHPFRNLAEGNDVLRSLSGTDGPLIEPLLNARAEKGEVHWTFVGSLDFSKGLAALADQDLITAVGKVPWVDEVANKQLTPTDVASITFKLSLPGTDGTSSAPTAASNGEAAANDSTADEWTVRPGDAALDLSIETVQVSKSVQRARGVRQKAVIALIIYLVLVGGFVAFWLTLRSRRRAAQREATARPPMKVAELLDLPPEQRRTMRYLLRFEGPPTLAELAGAVGVAPDEMKQLVRELVRVGLVRVEQGRIHAVMGRRSSRVPNRNADGDPFTRPQNDERRPR